MDTERFCDPNDKGAEHTPYGDSESESVSRTGSTGLTVMSVNIPNLLTTLGLAGALIWHASVVTWRASELSTAVRQLQGSVEILRTELRDFQGEQRRAQLNVENRLSRVEAQIEAHVRGGK